MTEWLSWRWCLYVNLLFAVPAAALVFTSLPAKEVVAASTRQLDWPGVLAVSGGLFCLVYGLSNAQTDSWTAPLTVSMFVTSAALLALFIPIEVRAPKPLLPLHIVADRNRIGSYLAIGIAFCSMFGVFLFLTYYLQQTLRYSPLMTGVAFLPFAAGIAVSAGLSNTQLVPRLGPRPLIPVGMATAAAGMFWLRHLTESSTYAGDVLGPLIVLGLGVGLTFAPAIATATAAYLTTMRVSARRWSTPASRLAVPSEPPCCQRYSPRRSSDTSVVTRLVRRHNPLPPFTAIRWPSVWPADCSSSVRSSPRRCCATADYRRNAGDQGTVEVGQDDEGAPANGADTVDVAALQRRIAELETENRYLQEVLHIRTVAASTTH